MGGSTSEGITSGLSRKGYKAAGSVDWGEVDVIADQMKKRYGAVPRQGYNVWDFLTEWGLNMASSPPMGNVIQTAAGTAKEPYGKFVEGKGKDEMTEYMANMASTDKALAAFTDIEAAKAEALGKRTLADRSDERILMEDPLKIMAEANKTNQGSLTIAAQPSGALGIVKAKLLIRDENAKGNHDVRQVPVALFKQDENTQLWDFNEQLLDTDTIWYDINKKQVLTITMEEDKKVANYHDSADAAREFLVKKSKDLGDGTGDGTGGDTGGDTGDGTKKVTEKDKWRYLPEDTSKKFSEWWEDTTSKEGSIGEADITLDENINLKAIVENEKKKNKVDKDYSDLDKWWKVNETSYNKNYNLGN